MSSIERAAESIIGFSPAIRRYASTVADMDPVLRLAGDLAQGRGADPPSVEAPVDHAGLVRWLRECRRRVLFACAVAEQATGDPRTTFGYLTACAQAWIDVAFESAYESACRFHGVHAGELAAACPYTVLGLGKLGACELNPSSDVDLLVVYGTDEGLEEGKTSNVHDLYERMSREAAAILSEATPDGFCLRVDFDLRPEGRSGALANSLDAVVDYYEQHGSHLDRMALTRARPVAGDDELGGRFLDSVEPFVFPRSLVSGALGSLAGVLGRLRDVGRRDPGVFNLKTGRGGIRDVELFVASFQLVHGGRLRDLRATKTLSVLEALGNNGLVEADEAVGLSDAYLFMRRLEHLLQYRDDRQTQDFPLTGPLLAEVSGMLEPGLDGAGLLTMLGENRLKASVPADRLFGLKAARSKGAGDPLEIVLSEAAPGSARETAAHELGFTDGESALGRIARLQALPTSPIHPRRQDRFPGFAGALLKSCGRSVWPDGALEFATRLARLKGSLRLFDLCAAEPGILDTLLDLGSSSRVVADVLSRDAGLVLEQALTGFEGGIPDAAGLSDEVGLLLSGADQDQVGERLASFRERQVAAIAIADIAGSASDEDVGRGLSLVADACISGALDSALGGSTGGLVAFGFGRLGGGEMGYLSDLDLVFVHDGGAERLLPAVQRALGILTTRGVSGSMYTLDLRLRPSGTQGPLMVPVSEFERYYREEAHGPELLGSLNLRPVAGDRGLGESIAAGIRRDCAARLVDPAALDEVRRVRERQHEGLEKTGIRTYDPKLEAGGLLDAETVAHLWVIQGARDLSAVPTGTLAILGLLAGLEGPAKPDFAALDRAYRFLQRLSNRAHLVLDRPINQASADGPAADRLARSLGFGAGSSPAEEMWDAYAAALDVGARMCGRLMAALPGARKGE